MYYLCLEQKNAFDNVVLCQCLSFNIGMVKFNSSLNPSHTTLRTDDRASPLDLGIFYPDYLRYSVTDLSTDSFGKNQ